MVDIIINFGQWIVGHWKEILITLTSSTTIGMILDIIALRKQSKDIKDNTASTKALSESTNAMIDTKKSVDNVVQSNEDLRAELSEYKTKVDKLFDLCTETLSKNMCIIEVLQIAYSTIKDENIRKTINNIINDVKYPNLDKVELEKQIKDLNNKLSEQAENIKNISVEKATPATDTIVKKTKTKNISTRY